ncbi:MAG: plasmid mobilization relaxosome protein MobC [Leptolyngbya sp. SIO1E4]|nr:plasmid mobilization relaxosome protein MobC [Leptolyngbya sp. SIO1E4]
MPRRRRSTTGEVANKAITIRLTPSEHEQVQAKLGALSMSDYFRHAGLGQKIAQVRRRTRPVPQVNIETYVELGHIGRNINQMAKACNTSIKLGYGCNIDPPVLSNLTEQIDALRMALIGVDPEATDEEDAVDWEAGEGAFL